MQPDPQCPTILHVAPTPFFADRGCHIRIRGVIEALAGRGLRSLLCTYHHGRDVPGIRTLRTRRLPGYEQLKAGPARQKYMADLLLLFRVMGALRRYRPRVLHAHLHEGAALGWLARLGPLRRRPPLIMDVQGSLVGELAAHGSFDGRPLRRRLGAAAEYLITRLPDRFVCSSSAGAAVLTERLGIPTARVTVVHDGADPAPAAIAVDEGLRARLRLPVDRPVVTYTGGLQRAKGVAALQELVRTAHDRGHDWHFLVVGYPVTDLGRFLARHGLEDRCTLAGHVPFEDLAAHLALAAVAVEPKAAASGEASGKLLNYMAAGLPIVCFDTAPNRELLADCGRYVAPGSVDGLRAGIAALLDDPIGARHLGERARARVRARFTWNAAGAQLIDVYRSALAAAGDRGDLPATGPGDVSP